METLPNETITVSDRIKQNKIKSEEANKNYHEREKIRQLKIDETCRKIKERIIEETIKYIKDNKESLINKFELDNSIILPIELQNMFKDIYLEIFKKPLPLQSWERDIPKRAFYNTDHLDFDLSKKFYESMGKYLINDKKYIINEPEFKNCYLIFEKGRNKSCVDCWYEGDRYETNDIIAKIYYDNSFCSIM
jgi:hypothetical protein